MKLCAYCGIEPAIHLDHVVPKSLRKTHRAAYDALPPELKATVRACFSCNLRKGTRRLAPPSWAGHVDTLNTLLPGTAWRVWRGGVREPAFAEAWS